MLKQIKNITGAMQLSKKEQQELTAGFGTDGYYCPGGEIIVLTETCPPSYPFMHPKGHCLCCQARWVPALEE